MIQRQKCLLIAVALAFAGLGGCKEEEPPPLPPRPVLAMTLVPVTQETFGPFASTVEARYQTQLGFQLSGRMIARDVYIGDLVSKGQRLAALDPTVPQFNLKRAKADVADARAQLANAEGIESRQRILAQGGNASQATLDNAIAGKATAQARLDQMLAALRLAEEQMSYTELHANFEGVVTAWNAEVGQFVSSGSPVVTVARPDEREAVVDIPDDLMLDVKPGTRFDVHLLVAPKIEAKGIVREITPVADPATRSRRVRLTLVDAGPAFRLGATISVASEHTTAPRIYAPATAILEEQGRHFAWLLAPDGKSVHRREVKVTPAGDSQVQILSGLSAGDKIVTVGVHSLVDGQAVGGEEGAALKSARAQGTRL